MPEHTPTETPVFTLEYRNAVDGQWRVTVPSDWRFADRAEFFIRVKKDHLVVLPRSEMDRYMRWANTLSGSERAQALEAWGATSMRVKIDSAGRITLPSDWAKRAGIETKKNAVLVGSVIDFKIWSEAQYDAQTTERETRQNAVMDRYDNATLDRYGE